MTETTEGATQAPVRKSITVKASVDRAFEVFTNGIDSWWPREHQGNALGRGLAERVGWHARPVREAGGER